MSRRTLISFTLCALGVTLVFVILQTPVIPYLKYINRKTGETWNWCPRDLQDLKFYQTKTKIVSKYDQQILCTAVFETRISAEEVDGVDFEIIIEAKGSDESLVFLEYSSMRNIFKIDATFFKSTQLEYFYKKVSQQ
ncbi:hypothetical protein BDW_08430 [Bdellovibrio bacteriovorus W]|nr:hypothetical protein BDW_08430 [Bdellovibrio bacteriovorus W]